MFVLRSLVYVVWADTALNSQAAASLSRWRQYLKSLKKYITLVFLLILNQCSNGQDSSRVRYFLYGGFGDNVNATLYGKVYCPNKCKKCDDSLSLLKDVQVIVFDNKNTIYTKILVDSSGSYSIDIPGGIYKIIFDMKNFEPLTITNYAAVADQFTTLDIFLKQGYKIRYHRIPDWETFSQNR